MLFAFRFLFFLTEEKIIKDLQINDQIRDREIRLIDEEGTQLGVISTQEALRMASYKDLDLVKISPTAVPPVCKIMNYGKYKYDQSKHEKESRKNQKATELKEIQLSAVIDTNDLNTKAKHAVRFLSEGDKVKVVLKMRGRQLAHPEIGMGIIEKFYDTVKDAADMEKKPSQEGKSITLIIAPKKQ
ncbi:MAG: translation initiation factor IF-3 [Clostridiales bacterium]|jgi:translation initiation factor IF-3|nr:translation initiation factor IF-3 [Clostridiales bacterium]